MIFSYNWLQSFFRKKLPPPRKLAELLTLHSFEVQEIEKRDKDFVLDLDVTPNRASDCFSHLGIAREISAIIPNSKFKIPNSRRRPKYSSVSVEDLVEIEIENKNDCPRYCARIIQGVKIQASPKWLQERLIACGMQPINNIVDATNYVMLELGQPLHAFDLDKIEISNLKSQMPARIATRSVAGGSNLKKKIIVRRAKKGEKIEALDGKIYELNKDILVIADAKDPIAIAGIKGGRKAEITSETTNILIESANFNPHLIRRASKQLKLKTDASFRFEHGLDPNMAGIAIDRVTRLIQEIAGGKILKGKIDHYPNKVKPWRIYLNPKKVHSLLGVQIKEKEMKDILKRLGLTIKGKSRGYLIVEVPTFRKNLEIEEDLIEEIGRIFGYQKIKPIMPAIQITLPEKNLEIYWENKIKKLFKELKFCEVYNYSFIGKKDAVLYPKSQLVELENPISEEFQYLRPTLLINLLKNAKENLKYFSDFQIFEIGKVFRKERGKILEKRMLSGLITANSEEGFFYLKGLIDTILRKLGISDFYFDQYQQTPEDSLISFWHLNKSAEIKIANQEIGFLGEISLRILDYYHIKKRIYAFDIDFEKLLQFVNEEQEYIPISKYPSAVRDIAVLVPLNTKVAEVMNVIYRAGGKFLRDIDLFDIYVGENIPEGKKNLAFHLIFQAEDRTLQSEEIDRFMAKIIEEIEKNVEWEVRK